jgi:hypothetical protein
MAIFRAYQTERTVLNQLYEAKLISQYVYLRMDDAMYSMQEALRKGKNEHNALRESKHKGLFIRLEISLLRYAREKLWLSKILSKYQLLRVAQQIERHMAKVVISKHIIAMLEQQHDLVESARQELISNYKARNKHYRRQLKLAKKQIPGFYRRNLELIAHRSMINRGWSHVEHQNIHHDLSAKGYNIIRQKVLIELSRISSIWAIRPETSESVSDLLDQVEFFGALSSEDLNFVENNATWITFLAEDTIVGESERGDNFYVIIHGNASVVKISDNGDRQVIAKFSDGDIIGESSLLIDESGSHRRSATIIASTPCKLLRITRKAMMKIIEKYPDIRLYLQKIHEQRVGE